CRMVSESGSTWLVEGGKKPTRSIVMLVNQPSQPEKIVPVDNAVVKRQHDLAVLVQDEQLEAVALRDVPNLIVILDLPLHEEQAVLSVAERIGRTMGTEHAIGIQHDPCKGCRMHRLPLEEAFTRLLLDIVNDSVVAVHGLTGS